MKTGLILTSFLATGGTAGASATIGYVGGTLKTQDLNAQQAKTSELSSKNIPDISKISDLKEQNKIVDLTKVVINKFEKANDSLDLHYYTPLNTSTTKEESDVKTLTYTISLNQATLQDLLKEQIKLAKQKEVYDKIKTHFTNNQPNKTTWEIVKDATVTSGDACKIQKIVSTAPAKASGAPYDICTASWQIITFSPEDKIKQLLVGQDALLKEFQDIQPTT